MPMKSRDAYVWLDGEHVSRVPQESDLFRVYQSIDLGNLGADAAPLLPLRSQRR